MTVPAEAVSADPTPVLTAKLAQLLNDHPDFYAQIFAPKKDNK